MFFLATAATAVEHGGATPPPSELFLQLYSHVQAHTLFRVPLGEGSSIHITNHTIMELMAGIVAFMIFYSVARMGSRRDRPRGAFHNAFEAVVLFVRDEMVYKVMHREHADRLMPLFLTFFIFILFCNLLGLVPIPTVGGTATGNIAVTAALAVVTLFMMIYGGMTILGPVAFWKGLVPHGLPKWMVPFIFTIEVLGLIIKPFALTIRLFANMIAGHLVILSFFGLVFFFESYIIMMPALLLAVFITLLEVLVCFLQAYVFTYLSIIFVSMAIQPEH